MKTYNALICAATIAGSYMLSSCHTPQQPQPIIYGTLTIPMKQITANDEPEPLVVKNIRLLRAVMNDPSLEQLIGDDEKGEQMIGRMMELLPKEWRKQAGKEVMKARAREFFYTIRDAVEDKLHEVLSTHQKEQQ